MGQSAICAAAFAPAEPIRRTLNPATEVIIRAAPTGAASRLQHLTGGSRGFGRLAGFRSMIGDGFPFLATGFSRFTDRYRFRRLTIGGCGNRRCLPTAFMRDRCDAGHPFDLCAEPAGKAWRHR